MANARIKIVPDAEPNAPGEWREIQVDNKTLGARWTRDELVLKPWTPPGFHVVAYESLPATRPQATSVRRRSFTTDPNEPNMG